MNATKNIKNSIINKTVGLPANGSYDFTDYPKLYFPFLVSDSSVLQSIDPANIFKYGVCVDKCPQAIEADQIEVIKCPPDAKYAGCTNGTYKSTVADRPFYDSTDAGGYCFPVIKYLNQTRPEAYSAWKEALNNFEGGILGDYLFNDMYNSSWAVYISMGTALVYSALFMCFLSYTSECIAFFIIGLHGFLLTSATSSCFYMYFYS